jgi:hypothetical protein
MKKIFILLVLLLAGIAGYFMLGNPLGHAVKLALEEFGPKVTQAEVRVSSVKISATDGQGGIAGLQLGNPKPFKTDYAMQAGKIELAVEPASLVQDTIVIHKVLIVAPKIIYESGDHGSNLDAIQRNIKQYLKVDANASGNQQDDKAVAKKMIIESLIIRNAHVSYNDTLSLDLPDIELRDIGKKTGGATSAQVVKAIISDLTTQILLAIPKVVAGGVTSALKGLFQ